MNKKERELLVEICRFIEYLAHNCAEHLKSRHGDEDYPYFSNIEQGVRELIERIEEK